MDKSVLTPFAPSVKKRTKTLLSSVCDHYLKRVYHNVTTTYGQFASCLVLLSLVLNSLLGIHFLNRDISQEGISDEATIKVPGLGTIRGAIEKTANTEREYLSFRGIPYGKIPVRFAPAVLSDSLNENDVFDATQPQKACLQPKLLPFLPGNFTEDCLSLNIFTPKKDVWDNRKLPVIVFIHGGSFFRWSGNMFDGRRILERDVVLVTINYRINLFGFFCLGNDEAPGNLGLYDQILALKWIQKYISYFGGDPGRVTIAGQSAGAATVTYLLDSPLAKGLFQGVIPASGDSFAGWAVQHDPIGNSLSAANVLGCSNGTEKEGQDFDVILKCMRNTPPERLIEAMPVFFSAPSVQNFPLLKTPKIIPKRETKGNRFISDVPIMIGINRNDGSFLLSRIYTDFLAAKNRSEDYHYLRSQFVEELLTSSHFGFPNDTANALAKQYIGEEFFTSGKFEGMAHGLTEIYSRFYFTQPSVETALRHSKFSDTYFYSFDYEGEQTLYPYTGGVPQVPRGVSHGDDLMYLFYFGDFKHPEEQMMSKLLVDYWVNFATTGNPNKNSINQPTLPDQWPKFCAGKKRILRIGKTLQISTFAWLL